MKRSLSGTTRRLASATTVVVIGLLASRELHAQGGTMRGLTAKQIVCDMFAGWNLGNTMDSSPNETSWGNPTTTQAMIDAVKAMGFNAVRIPVTWASHIGAAPGYPAGRRAQKCEQQRLPQEADLDQRLHGRHRVALPVDEQDTLQNAVFTHQIFYGRNIFILVALLGSRRGLALSQQPQWA